MRFQVVLKKKNAVLENPRLKADNEFVKHSKSPTQHWKKTRKDR